MSKRTFITFGVLLFVLAVVIPWLAFRGSGDANTGAQEVPAHLKAGQALFETNCGTCHTLYAAGTDGNYGPNLDELLAPTGPPEEGEAGEKQIKSTTERVLDAEKVPAHLKTGQALFQTNCGTCHTLYSAGTDGNYGPDLDELLATTGQAETPEAEKQIAERVLNAEKEGVDSNTPGRMPPAILNPEQQQEVAEFVGATAGAG